MNYEVVVVGGGPAGALAAKAAAEKGAKTLVLERSPTASARCAGLVSPQTAERLSVPKNLILREIFALRIIRPSGKVYELRAKKPKGLVMDRTGLNHWLRQTAQESGADIWSVAAKGIEDGAVITAKKAVRFGVLIGADGAKSLVARAAGLSGPEEILVAAQAEVLAELGDTVEVHLGVVPDFFAWAVPAEEGICRVGLATASGRTVVPKLREFLARRFPGGRVLAVRTGLIPIGPPTRIARGRVLLVGNAAGQVKPLTGGGLAFLSRCAPICGEMAAQGPKALPAYARRCQAEIGTELAFELRLRRAFLTLSSLAVIETVLSHPELIRFLEEEAEIDHFAVLFRKILARPSLFLTLRSVWPKPEILR